MEFIDNSILSKCDSDDKKISKTSEIDQMADISSNKSEKNILISDTKRKRKLSSDSLDSLDENDEILNKSCPISSAPSSSSQSSSSLPIEKFLNETTGFNVKVINKNDKKLVKINLNNSTNNFNLSQPINKQLTFNNNQTQLNKIKTTIIKINNTSSLTSNNMINEIDDLPSESDISNGTILIPKININNVAKDLNNNNVTVSKPLKICFKCNKCNKLFDNESLLKTHQDTICSTVELVKISLNNETSKASSDNDLNEIIDVENDIETKSSNNITKKRSFICNECGIQVKSQSELNKHMLHSHQDSTSKGQLQYKCSQCQMIFNDMSSKNRHEKEHAGMKPFRCYICSFEFTRASNLRSHLLKVHPNDIDKLVRINKTEDNKLKFEFDLDAINEKQRLKTNGNKSNVSLNSTSNSPTNNAVIYIKDPNNKNADIQHMVVYVDGKPIFVENSKLKQSTTATTTTESTNSVKLNHKLIQFVKTNGQNKDNDSHTRTPLSSSSPVKLNPNLQSSSISLPSTPTSNKPVTKIPYLLAAAAAASNNRKLKQSSKLVLSDCARSSCYLINNTQSKLKVPSILSPASSSSSSSSSSSTNKQDHEYHQLVSMFRQKNEKLYNPLLNKSF